MSLRPRLLLLLISGVAGALIAVVSCVGDSPNGATGNTGGEGQPCFANGTCSPGLSCLSKVCVALGDGALSLDGAAADSFAPPNDAADAGMSTQDAGIDGPTGPYCDQIDAAYCEDFDHNRTLPQIGNTQIVTRGGSATLTIVSSNPISAPSSLVAAMSGGQPGQAASLTHDFSTTLGAFTRISADADFRCTAPTSEIAGTPLGFFFWTDTNYNSGHQVLASLYPTQISIDEGLTFDGGLSGAGAGTQLAFDCNTPATHHVTLAIHAAGVGTPPYVATLTLDGKASNPLTLSSGANGFAFSPRTTLILAAQNNFNGTALTLTMDNVVVRTQ